MEEISELRKEQSIALVEHQAIIERLHHDHSIQMEAIISKHDADVRAFKKEHVEQLKEVRAITDAKSVEYEQLQLKCCALEDQLGGMEGTSTTTTTSSVIEEMNHRIQSQLTEINHLENELLGMKERLQQVESEYESYRIDTMMEIQKRSQELNGSMDRGSIDSPGDGSLFDGGPVSIQSTDADEEQFQAYRDNSKFVSALKAHASEYIRRSRRGEQFNKEVIKLTMQYISALYM